MGRRLFPASSAVPLTYLQWLTGRSAAKFVESRMRFEVAAGYVLGVALPALEVWRRGSDFSQIAAYADDFLAGGLLLWAAVSSSMKRPIAPILLVVAWAVLCGGFYYSFFGQLESTARSDVSGLSNAKVIAIKGALYAVAILALILSVRNLSRHCVPPKDAPR